MAADHTAIEIEHVSTWGACVTGWAGEGELLCFPGIISHLEWIRCLFKITNQYPRLCMGLCPCGPAPLCQQSSTRAGNKGVLMPLEEHNAVVPWSMKL